MFKKLQQLIIALDMMFFGFLLIIRIRGSMILIMLWVPMLTNMTILKTLKYSYKRPQPIQETLF